MKILTIPCGPLSTNSYICANAAGRCFVVDPAEAEPVLAELEANGLTCDGILITHGHFDHIGGLAQLQKKTDAPVYVHPLDAPALSDDVMNLAEGMGFTVQPSKPDHLVTDGEILEVAGCPVEVLHTPGHSPGSVCYRLTAERVLFCGDTVFAGSYGRTDFPGGNARTLYLSVIKRIFRLPPKTMLYPGHGPQTDVSRESSDNPILFGGLL